jgi:hypothetical protein
LRRWELRQSAGEMEGSFELLLYMSRALKGLAIRSMRNLTRVLKGLVRKKVTCGVHSCERDVVAG